MSDHKVLNDNGKQLRIDDIIEVLNKYDFSLVELLEIRDGIYAKALLKMIEEGK